MGYKTLLKSYDFKHRLYNVFHISWGIRSSVKSTSIPSPFSKVQSTNDKNNNLKKSYKGYRASTDN